MTLISSLGEGERGQQDRKNDPAKQQSSWEFELLAPGRPFDCFLSPITPDRFAYRASAA